MVASQVDLALAKALAQAKKIASGAKKVLTRGRWLGTRVPMVGYVTGCRVEGIAPRRLSTTNPSHVGEIMAKFGFKKNEAADENGETITTGEPQAYVFLGRDKYRADEQPEGAQGWRKLFLTLAEMAAEGTQGKVTQNTFGLEILFTGLLEIQEQAKAELGDAFQATFDATWSRIQKREQEKAERKAARMAADAAAEQAREEADKPETKPVGSKKK